MKKREATLKSRTIFFGLSAYAALELYDFDEPEVVSGSVLRNSLLYLVGAVGVTIAALVSATLFSIALQ
jgi:hypothetical protein